MVVIRSNCRRYNYYYFACFKKSAEKKLITDTKDAVNTENATNRMNCSLLVPFREVKIVEQYQAVCLRIWDMKNIDKCGYVSSQS